MRLYAAHATPRHVWLSLQPGTFHGQVLLREATSQDGQTWGGTVYGPFDDYTAPQALEERLAYWRALGYDNRIAAELRAALQVPERKRRARAAVQLGWRQPQGALEALLAAAEQATTEISSIVDALGRLCNPDPRVLALARAQAEKKLLSRRRSGVECLRALGDAEGLAQARALGRARLNPDIRQLLDAAADDQLDAAPALTAALQKLDPSTQGLHLDQLYEEGTPLALAAIAPLLSVGLTQIGRWRYTKSVFKRALLRADAEWSARLAYAIEQSTPAAQRASLKSGLDGQQRSTAVASAATRAWLLRAMGRHLRRLARWQPEDYAATAQALLCCYQPVDQRAGAQPFAHCLLLQRLLYAPDRLRKGRRRRAGYSHGKLPTPGSVPEAWRQAPSAFLQLAYKAQLPLIREWVERAALRESWWLTQVDADTLAQLLALPALRNAAGAELQRRFDPAAPDFALCGALLDGPDYARAVALGLLAGCRPLLQRSADAVQQLLTRHSAEGRAAAAEAVLAAWQDCAVDTLLPILRALLAQLGAGDFESQAGRVAVLTPLAAALAGRLEPAELLALIDAPALAAQSVGASLLAEREGAWAWIGAARIRALAGAALPAIRQAAVKLLEQALHAGAESPEALLALADAPHADTRAGVLRLIAATDFSHYGPEAVVRLCDSIQPDVQQFAIGWVRANLGALDAGALLLKLVEHPRPALQSLAIELLEDHLPPGLPTWQQVAPFLRACLRRPGMPRRAKDRVLQQLSQRGRIDAAHAAVAVTVLDDSLRTRTLRDREQLMPVLAALLLQFPELSSALALIGRTAA
jgi:hypothetical protein